MRKKDLISKRLLLYLCSAPSTQLPFHYFHSFSVFPYLVDHLLQPFLLPLLMSLKQLYQMKLGNSYSQSLLLLSRAVWSYKGSEILLSGSCLTAPSGSPQPLINSSLLPSSTQLSSSTPQIILYERKVSNPGSSLPHTILFLFSLGLQHPCRQPTPNLLATCFFFSMSPSKGILTWCLYQMLLIPH